MRARKSLRTRALNCCGGSPPGSAAAGEVLAFHRPIADRSPGDRFQMFPRSSAAMSVSRSASRLRMRRLLRVRFCEFHRLLGFVIERVGNRFLDFFFESFRLAEREVRSGSLRQPPPLRRPTQIRAAAPRAPLLRFAPRPRARRWSPLRLRSVRWRHVASSACFGGVQEFGLLVLSSSRSSSRSSRSVSSRCARSADSIVFFMFGAGSSSSSGWTA